MGIAAADTFARPDAATLGNAETGPAWELSNAAQPWNILSGTATRVTGTVNQHHCALLDVGSTDHEISATLGPGGYFAPSGYYNLVVRYLNSTNYILLQLRTDATVTDAGIYTFIAGVYTKIATATDRVYSGSRITLRCEGTTITGLINGVVVCSATTSALAANTRCGLCAFYTSGNTRYSNVIARNNFGQPVIWNGSAWAVKPAKVWDGSAWVTKPMKIWAIGGHRRV